MATYGATVLRMAGFTTKQAIWLSSLPALANVVTKIIFPIIFVERVGRRKLCIISGIGTSLFMFLLAVSFLMETNASPSAVPLGDGVCNFDKCGSCVANSHCGFCALNIDGEYINGTCIRGGRDSARMRTNSSQCITWDSYQNSSDQLTWHFDYCPDNKYFILSFVSVLMFWVFVSIGLGPLTWVINSEIYPTWARGKAVAIATVFYYIATFISLITFLTLIDAIGQFEVIMLYGAISICGTVFIVFLLPETRRKRLEEMEILFTRPYFLTWCNKLPFHKVGKKVYTELELHVQERTIQAD